MCLFLQPRLAHNRHHPQPQQHHSQLHHIIHHPIPQHIHPVGGPPSSSSSSSPGGVSSAHPGGVSLESPGSDAGGPRSSDPHHHHGGDPGDPSGAGGGDGNGGGGESLSSYFNQLVGENPELRNVIGALEKYIPFIVLLVVKLFFDHGTGIIVCICLVTTFLHANSVLRQQVQRQARRNIWALVAILVNLVACIAFIYFVFQDDKIYTWYLQASSARWVSTLC